VKKLSKDLEERLINLGKSLINQKKAKVIINPYKDISGFWFGGGNIRKDPKDGGILVCGRYRNHGDSRLGISAGERGLELAIFKSNNGGKNFEKIRSWRKKDMEYNGMKVLSIEGASIHFAKDKIEMYVSTEKELEYPGDFRKYQKPGTGIWSIDVFTGDTFENLNPGNIKNVLFSENPASIHVKDPVVFDGEKGNTYIIYCQHPFSWCSGYTGCALREKEGEKFRTISMDILPRGYVWDIAVTRVTEKLSVPELGKFAELPSISLYFYDGAECVREHSQSERGVRRPRGYSCEEIGGLAYGFEDEFPVIHRLSESFPLFYSPDGTGCSRYVSCLWDSDGIIAVWQKSMPSYSQPLVFNKLDRKEIEDILL